MYVRDTRSFEECTLPEEEQEYVTKLNHSTGWPKKVSHYQESSLNRQCG